MSNGKIENEIGIVEIQATFFKIYKILKKKILVLVMCIFLGTATGFTIAYFDKPIFIANLSFALEDDKASGGGLSGAMGLASTLGIDLGTSAGGAFSGANLIELMKSRKIVERALLNKVKIDGKETTLIDFYLTFRGLKKNFTGKLEKLNFSESNGELQYQKDSIISIIYNTIVAASGNLLVYQKDKKVGIITVEVSSKNEKFAKAFTESLVNEVSIFYIESKSMKARKNVTILQKQTDSIRSELNSAISGVAIANDNVYNLNPAMNVTRIPSTKRQVDVQANTAILTQLVTNLEMAKVTLMKETPLIQIIDRPILPLKREKLGKLRSMISGAFLSGIFAVIGILLTANMGKKKVVAV